MSKNHVDAVDIMYTPLDHEAVDLASPNPINASNKNKKIMNPR